MKLKYLLSSLFILLSQFSTKAVSIDFNYYTSVQCKGPIPDVIKKYLETPDYKAIKGQSRASDLHLKMSDLLKKGHILYGDEMNAYVDQVADYALKADPELRKQLTFLIVKSSSVNAFETGSGIICINIGLLCHVQNEAQLALIICHEAMHFKLKHYEKSALRHDVLSKGRTAVNGDARTKLMVSQSKTFEIEADESGFELFLKSPYASDNAEKTFEMLKYSHLPYDNPAFPSDYFDDKAYNLPNKYFLTKSRIREAKKSEYNHLNVHPDIDSRQENILRYILKNGQKSGINYCDSPEKFEYIRRKARYELPLINIREGLYPQGFYNAFILERKYGESQFIDKIKAHTLYAMCAIKNKQYTEEKQMEMVYADSILYCYDWKLMSGNSQNFHYFIHKIPASELNVLALKELNKYHSKYKTDFLAKRKDELCQWLVGTHGLKADEFNFNMEADEKDSASYAIKEKMLNKGLNYFNFAFNNEFKDSGFINMFLKAENLIAQKSKSLSRDYTDKVKKVEDRYGMALDINQLTVISLNFRAIEYNYAYFDSVYYKISVRNPDYSMEDELRIEKNFEKLLLKYARAIGIQLDIKDSLAGGSLNTDKYNEFQNMKYILDEMLISNGQFRTFGELDTPAGIDSSYFGIVQLVLVEDEMKINFHVIDISKMSIVYCFRTSLENVGPENVKTRASLYEILDHIRQEPYKISKIKREYGIEN